MSAPYTSRQRQFHELNLRVIELRQALQDALHGMRTATSSQLPVYQTLTASLQQDIAVLDEHLAYLLAHKDWEDHE